MKISKFISKLIGIILSALLIISNGVASIEHNIEFYSAEQYSKFDNPKSATSAGAGIYSSSYINTIAPVAINATNSDKEISKQIYDYNRQRLLSSQLTGILIGSLLNDTNGANLGYNLATSAELNNRQLHQKEMEFINNQDNINKFKQILQKNNQDIKYSDEEVISILAKGGISLNDKSFNEAYNKNLSNDEINKINLAREFIKQSSFYNTNLGQTNAFNPTSEQYNDRYMYLDTFVNNKNFYEQNLKVNTSFTDKSKGFATGVADGGVNLVKDTITGTYHLVTSPIDTTKSIYNALINADELINQGINKSELDLILGDYKSATSRDFEFIAGLTGSGTITKGASKGIANKIEKAATNNINEAIDLSKYPIGNVGDVGRVVEKVDGADLGKVANSGVKTLVDKKEIVINLSNDISKNFTNWIVQKSNKGGGIRYIDPANPHNEIRLMPGNKNSPNIKQQNPYLVIKKNGQFYNINGKVIETQKPSKSPEAHIEADKIKLETINNIFNGE